jgi:soluble lytic murein transglycosylase-like protein
MNIEPVLGPDSVLPYGWTAYDTVARRTRVRRTSRTITRALTPWALSAALLAGGVSIARSATPLPYRRIPVLSIAPVVVAAPTRAEWRVLLRRDTVARMLTRKHVDSATAYAWAHDFVRYGEELHVNPKLLVAIAYAESEFHPQARSSAGAIGLMQVVPARSSWREYEPSCGHMSARTLHDPSVNICFGAHIFREFLTRHHGDTDRALAAYNNGSGELNGYPDRVYTSLAALRH